MNKRKMIVGIILGGMSLVIIALSIRDYLAWRWEERKNYGKGPSVETPLVKADTMYQNKFVGLRFRHPSSWRIEQSAKFGEDNLVKKVEIKNLVGKTRTSFLRVGERLYVLYETIDINKTLADIVDLDAKSLSGTGFRRDFRWVSEREYVKTDEVDMTVITWSETAASDKTVVYERGYARKGEKLLVFEVRGDDEAFYNQHKQLYREMYRSILFLK